MVVPLTDGYFHLLDKQSTNQSFVGEIKNGSIIFFGLENQRNGLKEALMRWTQPRRLLKSKHVLGLFVKKHELLKATASTASLQTRGFQNVSECCRMLHGGRDVRRG